MPRVHSLNRFVFSVPHLEEAERFYTAFGLKVEKEARGSLALHTYGHSHCWARIHRGEGPSKRLQYLSFGCFPDDEAPFSDKLRAEQRPLAAAHPLAAQEGGVWLRHPDGFPIQIVAAAKNTPDLALSPSGLPPAGKRAVAPHRSAIDPVRPRRLSHVLLFSPDVLGSVRFFESVLGLQLSDHSGDGIAFMHGAHGSDHHLIAIAKSTAAGLHHCSWEVGSLDEVGIGIDQMHAAGYTEGWGLGRHVLGSNYFYYARDPWGSYCEYSYDIDYIPEGHRWPAADHPPSDSFYLWGPPVPRDFVTNYEAKGD
jgi:catechol 2,3-dioxygenase-like lactoylglutathione lyase family enzyme